MLIGRNKPIDGVQGPYYDTAANEIRVRFADGSDRPIEYMSNDKLGPYQIGPYDGKGLVPCQYL